MNFYKKATQILTNRMRANGGTIRIHRLSDAEKFIWRMEQEGKVEFVERHSDDSATYRLKPAQTEAQPWSSAMVGDLLPCGYGRPGCSALMIPTSL